MGKSYAGPCFGKSAGERLTTKTLFGKCRPLFFDSRAHSFATLTHGGTGQADDGKGGDLRARVEICFDVDDDALDADQGAGVDDGEHGGLRFVGRAAFSITCLAALFSGGPYSPSRRLNRNLQITLKASWNIGIGKAIVSYPRTLFVCPGTVTSYSGCRSMKSLTVDKNLSCSSM